MDLQQQINDLKCRVRALACTVNAGSGSMIYPSAGIPISTGTAWATSLLDNSTNWNTAYTQSRQWDGGTTGLTASTGRTSLGGSTVGQNLFTATNPSAIRWIKINADNTITFEDAATTVASIGAVTGTGASTYIPYFTGTSALAGSSQFAYTQSTGLVELNKNQSAVTSYKVTNANPGTGAQAIYITSNGTASANYGIYGTGATAYGIVAASSAYLYSTRDIAFMADSGAYGNMKFATGGNAEKMRLSIAGGLSIGGAADANSTSLLDVTSTTKGVLIPRMTTTQKNAIGTPAEGLMVYDLTLHKLCVYDGTIWQAAW